MSPGFAFSPRTVLANKALSLCLIKTLGLELSFLRSNQPPGHRLVICLSRHSQISRAAGLSEEDSRVFHYGGLQSPKFLKKVDRNVVSKFEIKELSDLLAWKSISSHGRPPGRLLGNGNPISPQLGRLSDPILSVPKSASVN